jgi:hypothetical protein
MWKRKDWTVLNALATSQSEGHAVQKFIEARKGRLLMFRALLLMTPPHTFQLVEVLVFDMGKLIAPEFATDLDGKLGKAVGQQLSSMPIQRLNEVFLALVSNNNTANVGDIVKSQLGCRFVQCILKVAHQAGMHCHTVVRLSSRCCYTVITLLLHCTSACTVVALLLHLQVCTPSRHRSRSRLSSNTITVTFQHHHHYSPTPQLLLLNPITVTLSHYDRYSLTPQTLLSNTMTVTL